MSDWMIAAAQFVGLLLSLATLVTWLTGAQEKHLKTHMDLQFHNVRALLLDVDARSKESDKKIADVEREVLELKAQLPEKYVRREDYIRGQTVLESKLDALALKIENMQLREQNRP